MNRAIHDLLNISDGVTAIELDVTKANAIVRTMADGYFSDTLEDHNGVHGAALLSGYVDAQAMNEILFDYMLDALDVIAMTTEKITTAIDHLKQIEAERIQQEGSVCHG